MKNKTMTDKIYDLGAGFWNVRGSFLKDGVTDMGGQCSLIKLESGRFIFLDSYALTGDIREQVMALTNDGKDVEAVLNVHPYHTVQCAQMAKDFPQATFYGSERHRKQVPEVQWSDDLVESDTVAQRYPELEFAVPEGMYYIAPEESVHTGSLLVYHPASRSLHVDDTFEMPPSKLVNMVQLKINFQMTTKQALKDEPNAGKTYCDWVAGLAHKWRDTSNFCVAHSGLVKFEMGEFEKALLATVDAARPALEYS